MGVNPVPWVRGPTSTTCTVHSTEWLNDSAETCQACEDAPVLADQPGEAEQAQAYALADGALTTDDYERRFNSIARLARRWAKRCADEGAMGHATRLLAENIKADRAGAAIAAAREDKAWAEKQSKSRVRERRGLIGPLRAPPPATVEGDAN